MLEPQVSIRIPHEIKDLLGSLGSEERWRIIELLLNHRKLSYSDLRKILQFTKDDNGKFNYHLKELQKSGWLRKKIEEVSNSEENQKSFYMLSKFGLKALEGSMKAMDRQSYVVDPFLEIQKNRIVELPSHTHSLTGATHQHTLNFMTFAYEQKPTSEETPIPENNTPASISGKIVKPWLMEFGYGEPLTISGGK